MIAGAEAEKANIKQRIEIDNADRENEIQHLRRQLAEQKELMDGQTKLMNELQALCEFTQNDIIKANKDLNKRKVQKKQIALAYEEIDQSTITLKNRHGQLENQMSTLRQSLSPVKNDENKNYEDEFNYFGKPKKISPAKKTRSGLAMFTAETGFNKIENDKRDKERM